MIRVLGWLFRVAVNVLLVIVIVMALVSAAIMTGMIDAQPHERGTIETPSPVPDIPLVWEVTVTENQHPETPNQSTESVGGDPVTVDPGTTSTDHAGTTITSPAVEAAIHEQINEIRVENDLATLEHDDDIASISRTYSNDMAARGYFDHVSPEGDTPADRFGELYPSECRAVGENLALVSTVSTDDETTVAERIVDGWMNSEGHRENILTAGWERQGIGVYIDDGNVYATQKFCES